MLGPALCADLSRVCVCVHVGSGSTRGSPQNVTELALLQPGPSSRLTGPQHEGGIITELTGEVFNVLITVARADLSSLIPRAKNSSSGEPPSASTGFRSSSVCRGDDTVPARRERDALAWEARGTAGLPQVMVHHRRHCKGIQRTLLESS